jgi:hypothetical protein
MLPEDWDWMNHSTAFRELEEDTMSESSGRWPNPNSAICERCGHEIREASGFGWFHVSGARPSPDHAAKPAKNQ